jgi:hypothetical protein
MGLGPFTLIDNPEFGLGLTNRGFENKVVEVRVLSFFAKSIELFAKKLGIVG